MSSSIDGSEIVSVEIYRNHPSFSWTYSRLNEKQRKIALQIQEGGVGTLLISELSPVITLGRRTPESDLTMSPDQLASLGIDVFRSDRGGLATYHGPGQWVIFPVDRLERLTGDRRGVRKAVETLLEIALKVGQIYDPRAEIRSGCELGVWTERGKFASVGVHIENGVLMHGLAVNGFKTSQSFLGLRPCGTDAPLDYLISHSSEAHFLLLRDRLISETLKRFWKDRNLILSPDQGLTVSLGSTITAESSSCHVGS